MLRLATWRCPAILSGGHAKLTEGHVFVAYGEVGIIGTIEIRDIALLIESKAYLTRLLVHIKMTYRPC